MLRVLTSFIPPLQREGAGFIVRRVIGSRKLPELDPFLMLDHLGPITYAPGEAVGAPDHPHRGFEIATYILQGELEHLDSAGNEGALGAGWCQWCTAGSGFIHSEMPSVNFTAAGGVMEGFQLWTNLRAVDKMVPPLYQDTRPEVLPIWHEWSAVDAATGVHGAIVYGTGSDQFALASSSSSSSPQLAVKVLVGSYKDAVSPIQTRYPYQYWDVVFPDHGTGELNADIPEGYNTLVYVTHGAITLGGGDADAASGASGEGGAAAPATQHGEYTVTVLSAEDGGHLRIRRAEGAAGEVRCIVLSGAPLGEPIARHGPFVMNTREQLVQAFEDYQSGRMGSIEGARERRRATEAARAVQVQSGRWEQDEQGVNSRR